MRKVIISAVIAASALGVAAPAAAQYYPAPPPPYGNAYGYNDNRRTEAFMYRIDQFRRDLYQFQREGRLMRNDVARLDNALQRIRQNVMYSARNGLSSRENRTFDRQLDRLRAQMRAEMRSARGDYRNNRRDNDYRDRDRDGRNDRYEDDRGRYPG